jgi:DNA (cytosine-5)-methyltransferase 1
MSQYAKGCERMKIGSLCSGYGGLDQAVLDVVGGEIAWFFEYEEAPSKVLAYHWPDVPNYGDLTKADWAGIEKVDVMCGGTPCQDLSGAGKRAGMTEGTRSNLWVQMREGIAIQRPALVIWENVRGAYSACADSEMGRCPRCMGEPGEHRPFLRALGRVLGDLSALGYDAEVVPLRASDVGAAHDRYRVFVIASDTLSSGRDAGWIAAAVETARGWTSAFDSRPGGAPANAEGFGWVVGAAEDFWATAGRGDALGDTPLDLAYPESDQGRLGYGDDGPSANPGRIGSERRGGQVDMAGPPSAREADGEEWERDGHADLDSHADASYPNRPGRCLGSELDSEPLGSREASSRRRHHDGRALETSHTVSSGLEGSAVESAWEERAAVERGSGSSSHRLAYFTEDQQRRVDDYYAVWESFSDLHPFFVSEEGKDYWPAIQQHELMVGRRVPPHSLPDGKGGKHRYSPFFAEWMMGCFEGQLTDPAIGLTANEIKKAAGNGVVRQQARVAIAIGLERLFELVPQSRNSGRNV